MAGAVKPELSNEEKILLCLLQHARYEERMHVPHQLTQKGLSDGSGIRVNHIPRAVGRLMDRGEIEEFLAYVHGSKRRRKAYALTEPGKTRALEISSKLAQTPVEREALDGTRTSTTLGELQRELGREHSLLNLLDMLSDDGVLDPFVIHGRGVKACVCMTFHAPMAKGFIGRERELSIIHAWSTDAAKPILVVSGPRGIGKSWLIGRFLGVRGSACNCCYLDAANAKPYAEIAKQLEDFLTALEIKADASAPERFVETAVPQLAKRNAMVIMDSLTATAKDTEKLAFMLGSAAVRNPGFKVVFVTREPNIVSFFPSPDVAKATKVLRLGGLDKDSARRVLEGASVTDEELGVILDLTKGNPMALAMVFSEEVNELVADMPDLTIHENLMLRCLKAMDYVLTG